MNLPKYGSYKELCIIFRISTGTDYRWLTYYISKDMIDIIPRAIMGGTYLNKENSLGYYLTISRTSIADFTCYWAERDVTNMSAYTIYYR